MRIQQPHQPLNNWEDLSSTSSYSFNIVPTTRKKSTTRLSSQPQASCSNTDAQSLFHKNRSITGRIYYSRAWLCKLTTLVLLLAEISGLAMAHTAQSQAPSRSRCYSCASENMKENFLSRSRGPTRRKEEPKLYDNMCDLDTWLIREKSAVECDGSCFKWQQVLNNSGVYSYATIRGCYNKMFDLSSPQTEPEKTLNECMARQLPFDCVDQSSLMEWQCFCQGDYCNSGPQLFPTGASLIASLFTIYSVLVLI